MLGRRGAQPRRHRAGTGRLLSPGVTASGPDHAHVPSRRSVGLRSRLSPPEQEVRDGHHPGGADDRHHHGPHPLRASDLACWPPLQIDERRKLEDAFGNCRDGQQPAGAPTEIAPLPPGGHAILRMHGKIPMVAPYIGWHPSLLGDPAQAAVCIPAGIEPATPSVPSMRRGFDHAAQHPSFPHNRTGESCCRGLSPGAA
jgi:hypothetical protein